MGVRALSSSKAVAATVQTIGLRIVTGSYAEGMTLPKEIDLASEHGIGRSTLREAVKLLAGQGVGSHGPALRDVRLPEKHLELPRSGHPRLVRERAR